MKIRMSHVLIAVVGLMVCGGGIQVIYVSSFK
jgi:hypothetical protein